MFKITGSMNIKISNFQRKIELLSNIAIIILAVLICGFFISRFGFAVTADKPGTKSSDMKVGMKLPLTNMDWGTSGKTVVLALSANCHYCTESVPFYRELIQRRAGRGDVRFVVLMPQSIDISKQYLSDHNLVVEEIRQSALIGKMVSGTPTLIIVDSAGIVLNTWVGKLRPEAETEVVQQIFGDAPV